MLSNLLKALSIFFALMLFSLHGLASSEEEASADAEGPKVLYHDLKPAFVTNFASNDGKKLYYLKVDVSVRAKNQQVVDLVVMHNALVRHQLVMLLSRQSEAVLVGGGQEQIRQEALKLVQSALEQETGDAQIDDLLFTSFVVQR